MIACTFCGFEAPDDFAFCPKCATALTVPLAMPEERKIVTTVFCDLVGFTAMSEAADPEDVDAVLDRYHTAARKVIESHGGQLSRAEQHENVQLSARAGRHRRRPTLRPL